MSTIAPFTHSTPDGRAVTIRSANLDDAAACIAHAHALLGEAEFLAISPGEFKFTLEQEREWIQQHLDNPGAVIIAAMHEDQLVGLLDFRRPSLRKTQHAGSFGIGLRQAWQGMGIGSAMINAMLAWARANPLIDVVWLGVFATHTRAIALYERLGFKPVGRNPRGFKIEDGTWVDECIMAQFVSDAR